MKKTKHLSCLPYFIRCQDRTVNQLQNPDHMASPPRCFQGQNQVPRQLDSFHHTVYRFQDRYQV